MEARPSLLQKAVFFTGGFPGKVTVALIDRKAAGAPSTKVADAYWKKKKNLLFKGNPMFKKCPQPRISYNLQLYFL